MYQCMGFDPESQLRVALDMKEREFRRASLVREARGSRTLRPTLTGKWFAHVFAHARARFQSAFPEHQVEPVLAEPLIDSPAES
jgi:hypothetical protein